MKNLNTLDKYRKKLEYVHQTETNGSFEIYYNGKMFFVIASIGLGWEHVSISIKNTKKCPTWEEMCYIKDMFFEENETVMQLHPKKTNYVNNHKYCLHLWKPVDQEIPTPPKVLV